MQAQEGSTELGAQTTLPTRSKEGVSLSGRRLEMGRVGSLHQAPQQPGASLHFLRAATCAVSHGQPLRASGFGPSSPDLFPRAAASTINMHALSGAPCWASQIKGFSPLQRNLTPASVFKDKNLCIKRPSDSEGTVWLIYFFLHIICLAFVETMKLFSFFRHETWPGKP